MMFGFHRVRRFVQIQLDNEGACFMQGLYAVVEFAKRESVASLLDEAVIPSVSHEATVPFKSRLLSLRNLGSADQTDRHSNLQCQPQTSVPINQLINRLSGEETVSKLSLNFNMCENIQGVMVTSLLCTFR